jgi:hypothetical protein
MLQVYISYRDSSKICTIFSAVHKQAILTRITGWDSRSGMIVVCRGDVDEGPTSHGEVVRTRENAIAELSASKP